MPGGPWSNQRNNLLDGLFGVFQRATNGRSTTAELWSDLRINAARVYRDTLGISNRASEEELEELGRSVLKNAGINLQNVNTYRSISGSWLRARNALLATDERGQIEPNAIFVAPWAKTTGGEIPSRFRIRARARYINEMGEEVTGWHSFETQSPLTSPTDLLDLMTGLITSSDRYRVAGPVQIDDYTLEQV